MTKERVERKKNSFHSHRRKVSNNRVSTTCTYHCRLISRRLIILLILISAVIRFLSDFSLINKTFLLFTSLSKPDIVACLFTEFPQNALTTDSCKRIFQKVTLIIHNLITGTSSVAARVLSQSPEIFFVWQRKFAVNSIYV